MPKHSMTTGNLRASNMQLVLQTALSAETPVSRAGIAQIVSLTRAGAASIVDDLVANDILDELPPARKTGPGRPAVRLVGSHRRVGIGIDIGVDGVRILATSLRGKEVARRTRLGDLSYSDPRETISMLQLLFTSMLPELKACGASNISEITFSVPGLVSAERDILLDAPNLGWHDVDIPGQFAAGLSHIEKLEIPITLMNEANAAALNTAWDAPGRRSATTTFAYISGGIGVGAAVVNEGELITGYHGWAGELGHLTVDPRGPECRCGSNGCLEQYVGRKVLSLAMGDAALKSAPMSATCAPAEALGIAMAALVNLVDVPVIVLGGHLSTLLDYHHEAIAQTLRRRALAAKRVNIGLKSCAGGEWAAARGASYQALADLLTNPQQRVRATQG